MALILLCLACVVAGIILLFNDHSIGLTLLITGGLPLLIFYNIGKKSQNNASEQRPTSTRSNTNCTTRHSPQAEISAKHSKQPSPEIMTMQHSRPTPETTSLPTPEVLDEQ